MVTVSHGYDDGFAFQFEPPPQGRTLRSVAIVNGAPELRFDRSEHTPSLTEEDVAAICRLAAEGMRPKFSFVAFHAFHPYYGRQYKKYDPPWLKDIALGDLLFEVDWKMKCLNVGLQTDESKSVFFSRKMTSKTKGLATFQEIDEPVNGESGSIFLSCREVPVVKCDNELVFINNPKLSIDSKSRPNYSKYITRVLPQISEHDEPDFAKFQEVIKMVLAAEWLRDKDIEMSRKWMTEATCNSGKQIAVTNSQRASICCPIGTEYHTHLDISPNKEEAKSYKPISAAPGGVWYGWLDDGSGEMVQFDEQGKLVAEIKSERMAIMQYATVNGEKMNLVDWLAHESTQLRNDMASCPSTDIAKVETHMSTYDGGKEFDITVEVQPAVKITTVIRASNSDHDFIYKGLPTGIERVNSWNELYPQTVPWPIVWYTTHDGEGVHTVGGGVRTDEVRAVPEKPRDGEHPRRGDEYPYTVAARCGGTLRVAADQKRLSVLKSFQSFWKKGICPTVLAVLTITNSGLQQKWETYQKHLTDKTVEPHFHGTALKCDIFNTKKLCQVSNCGICGITNEGFRPEYIRKDTFQRFGEGFYLAPNSSKANDYAHEYQGGGGGAYKALLLCDVCPGRKYMLKETDQDLKGPPPGYDSVYGQVGGDLNYPEIVVYNAEAVMPRHIILYR